MTDEYERYLPNATDKLAGCTLLAAALLKGYQLANEPAVSSFFLELQTVRITLTLGELLLGLVLVTGALPRIGHYLAVATFSGFCLVAAALVGLGHKNCGCLGALKIAPEIMLAFDLLMLAALYLAGPPHLRPKYLPRRILAVMSTFLLVSMFGAYKIAHLPVSRFDGNGPIAHGAELVVLEPESWVGKPFRLYEEIDIGERLIRGSWTTLFYHHDCGRCQRVIAGYADASVDPQIEEKRALIEVPPFGTQPQLRPLTHGQLNSHRRWFVETPLEVRIRDGVVASVQYLGQH